MEHITNLSKEYNSKLIYTTNDTLAQTFKKIIQKNNVNKSIGIQYTGEIIGNYDIYNKRDPIDTIDYYKKIGNNILVNNNFEYYTMISAVQFIYFFIIQDMDEHILIKQPTKIYS